jgi:predicted MFS family arabinose efflux permease
MRKNIVIMNLLVAFFWMTMYSYVPNLPEYSRSLGADAVVLGVIGGVYGIAQIILRIPIGATSDKTGKNKLMLQVGMGVLAASCVALIFADNTNLIILGRLIAGAAAAWWVVLSATYADYHHDDLQVKAQGVLSASSNLGKVAATVIGGIMAQFFGVHSIFIFSFFLAVGCFVLASQLTDLPEKPKSGSLKNLFSLFKNRDLIVLSLIGILPMFLCFAAPTLFTIVAAQDLGASSLELGMLTMVFFLATAVTSLFVGTRMYKKIGGINALAIAFLICAFSLIPAFYHINLIVVFLMQAVSGFGFGITSSAIAGLVIRAVHPHQRGGATGIFQSVYGIGIFIGPVITGLIIKAVSFDASYWFLLALSIASALLCWLLIPKKYAAM